MVKKMEELSMKKIIPVLVILCSFPVLDCCAGSSLDTLLEVGKTQGEISKVYAQETKNFQGVKKAIDSGVIKAGQAKNDIKTKFGEPVVAVQSGAREKWIYKPATSSFFEGEKISLFFNANGLLDEIKADK